MINMQTWIIFLVVKCLTLTDKIELLISLNKEDGSVNLAEHKFEDLEFQATIVLDVPNRADNFEIIDELKDFISEHHVTGYEIDLYGHIETVSWDEENE